MGINWPASLTAEIAERRCIIVLGAGASAGCVSELDRNTRPPNWPTLLRNASTRLNSAEDYAIVDSLINAEHYLDAAELVVANANPADYAEFLREVFVEPRFSHSEIHEEVYRLDAKIVVTTNYDDIYETYCKSGKGASAYNVCRYYETHAINDVRSRLRVIMKVHGCMSNPQRTVLSRTQYHVCKRDFPSYFNLLDSLFVTNTLLFIGCSLNDPDFQLMLEGTNIKCPSEHPHYAVVEKGRPQALIDSMRVVHNVHCLEFAEMQYDEVVIGLRELNDKVAEWRSTHP
ncbi:MAG: SIR2 family protein [Planctomycetaceae bacterium]